MASPYGTQAYKVPPTKTNKSFTQNKQNVTAFGTESFHVSEEEMADTEWPLEKTLPSVPRSHTTMASSSLNRPSVKGDEIVKTDPGSLTQRSISMIYTPKPGAVKSPEPKPAVNGLSKVEEKKEAPPPPKPKSPPPEPEPPVIETPSPPQQHNKEPQQKRQPKTPRTPRSVTPPKTYSQGGPYHALLRARSLVNDGVTDFGDLLKCPRCKRRIVEPKIICCRRMCQECLQIDIDHSSRDGIMWCDVCGNTILIPDTKQPSHKWAKQFETDTFLQNLREVVNQMEGKRLCFVCHSRKNTTEASTYCFDCDTYFCRSCTDNHNYMPNQKKHRIKPLDQVTASDLMKLKKRFCRTHEGMPLDLYCTDHKTAMCGECASTIHKDCGSIKTVVNIAAEMKEKLKTAQKVLQVGLAKCEHNTKFLHSEAAEIEQLKRQTLADIDRSFAEVTQALKERQEKLKKDINQHFDSEMPQFQQTTASYESLMRSMESKTLFLQELMRHASDFDVLSCADNIYTSAESMVSHNKEVLQTPRPKVIIKIDDTSVKNFVELVSILGAEVGSTQVKGILLKKITTKMKGDLHTPDIRDIFMAGESNILAVDNKNACVKSIKPNGDTFITRRLELKSEPWGGTRLQPNMIAVTGLKVIYVITLTDDLTLQSTSKTRKDYWGITAISPINLACTCKYPPGVDIIDITGRRLRSIEVNHLGEQLFEMPGYIAMNGDRILVTDRAKKSLTCVDQEGNVVFLYRGQGDEELVFPRGICVDRKNRIFVADHDKGCVHLLSAQGQYLCQVMSTTRPRTLTLDTHGNTLYLSTEGKSISFYNLIEVQN